MDFATLSLAGLATRKPVTQEWPSHDSELTKYKYPAGSKVGEGRGWVQFILWNFLFQLVAPLQMPGLSWLYLAGNSHLSLNQLLLLSLFLSCIYSVLRLKSQCWFIVASHLSYSSGAKTSSRDSQRVVCGSGIRITRKLLKYTGVPLKCIESLV